MSVSSRKITVVVDGTSTELQTAVKKAADSLKALGDIAAKQSKLSIDWGEKVITSNDAVATSYERVVTAAAKAAGELDGSVKSQITAQTELVSASRSTSTEVAAAAERQASAVRDASVVVVDASGAQTDALARVGTSATRTSAEVMAAAEKQATAMRGAADATVSSAGRSSAAARDSSAKSTASFAASGSGLVKLGKLTVVTAAAVAAGSLYMSSKFEASTTRLLTQAGATEAQIKAMRTGILSMAGEVGQAPQALSEGLYHVVSSMNKVLPAATRTNEELKIMRIAAEGAAIGGTSMEETTYALASAMNALHQNAGQAEHTMGLLNAIVGSGDMNMHDLLEALKSGLIPTAKTFGVSLQSVGAALAVMGDQGMRGALAGTRLRMALSLIAAPSEKAAEVMDALGMSAGTIHARTTAMSQALAEAGLTTTTMAEDLRKPDGITVALRDLWDHLKKAGLSATEVSDVFGRAFGGGRMSATTELLAQSVGRVGVKYDQVGRQVGEFGKDWSKTQMTLSQQVKQAEGAIESLGIKIGQHLTPAAETALHDLENMAKWLEHNKVAAELLAASITGVLGIAVTAFLANRVTKMVEGLKQIGAASEWLRSGFGASAAGVGASRSAGSLAPTVSPLNQTSGLLIGGSRSGYGLPGSMTNPIVVAVESGSFAGLGGESAAIGEHSASTAAESAAATAETRSPGGVILPAGPAARDAEAAAAMPPTVVEKQAPAAPRMPAQTPAIPVGAASAEEKSMMMSFRTTIGTALDRMMKGGMVGLMGSFAAQVAGSAIGGKAGNTVKGIGTDTALGAAIGTAIEPGIGTAIGAGMGGVVGAIKALQPPSVADKAASKLGPQLGAKFHQEAVNLEKLNTPSVTGHGKGTLNAEIGHLLGKSEKEYVLSGTRNPGMKSIIDTTKRELDQLTPMGREAFIGMVHGMVTTLEHEGRLPKGSLAKLISDLKPELKNLPHMAASTGREFGHEFIANLQTNSMLGKLSSVTAEINKEWDKSFKLLPVTTHQSLGEAETTANHDLGVLTHEMKTGTAEQRKEAETEYKKLAPALQGFLVAASDGVKTDLTALAHHTGPLSAEAVSKIVSAYNALPKELKEKLDNAGGAVKKGLEKINAETNTELKVLGAAGSVTAKITKATSEGFARGGLVQFGRAGAAGHDTIPLSMGGQNIVVGSGEMGAVLTRHQQAFLNQRTADVGGLPGVINKINTPNYMASGGIVRGPVSTFGPPGEAAGGTAYGSSSSQPGIAVNPHGGANWNDALARSFANMVARVTVAGHSANLKVIDKGPSAVGSHGPRVIDITGAGVAAMGLKQASFPTDAIGEANFGGKDLAAAIGGAAAGIAKKITEPRLGGSGALGAISQSVMHKATTAANSLLKREAARTNTAGGAGSVAGAVGPPSGVAGLGTFDGLPVADWIIPELQYAQAHGWKGSITSGWRSPTEVVHSSVVAPQGQSEHQGTQYPHGAVDFGSPSEGANRRAFELAVAHYTGKRLVKATGFVDEGHMSGTGHARGGLLGFDIGGLIQAATGHIATAKTTTTKGKSQKTLANAAKPKSSKGKKGTAKVKVPSFKGLAGHLKDVPEAQGIVAVLARQEAHLRAKQEEESLLSSMESQPAQIMPGDMQYLNPYLQGMSIRPGQSVPQAEVQRQLWLQHHEANPNSDLTGEMLTWIGGLDNHRLLSAGDVGVLSPLYKESGVALPVDYPIFAGQSQLLGAQEQQETTMHRLVEEGVDKMHKLGTERRNREMAIQRVQKREYDRAKKIKGAIAKLTTESLKEGLKAAEAAHLHSELTAEAKSTRQSYKAEINEERAREHPDKNLIKELEARESEITVPSNLGTTAISKARIAIVKDELKNELTPIEETLYRLGGSKTTIGTSGAYGVVDSQRKGLEAAAGELRPKLGEEASAISNLKLTSQGIAEAATNQAEQPAPVIMPGTGETTENSALVAALERQNEILARNLATSTSQFGVLQNFEMNLPHFEKGGPILEDGPIYAHRGEHVVPRDGALVSNGGGSSSIHVEHTTVLGGELGPLMKVIDQRIQHPDNVRVVSRQMTQRTNNFPGFRR